MRRLILMRHAKSSWDHPALDDFNRPLNDRGIASADALGQWLRGADYLPQAAVVSAAERTRQTFAGLRIDAPARFTRALYHAGADAMMAELARETAQCVLMIGHNPGIADFAERLFTQAPDHARFWDYPTGATLVADFAEDAWSDVAWGTGHAVDFVVPRELMG